jgi:hypothetical protein
MKIPVTIEQKTEVTISEHTQKSIVLDYLYDKFGWSETSWIYNGELITETVGYTSHSFSCVKERRPATFEDVLVNGLIEAIKYNKYKDEAFFDTFKKDLQAKIDC